MDWSKMLQNSDDKRWEIPATYKPGIRAPGVVFTDKALLEDIIHDPCLEQVANVAFLPGIVG